MKGWSKRVTLMAANMLLVAGAAGCSNSASANGSQGVVQLTYWNMWSGHWEDVVKSLVNQFNKTHPHIHVNVLSIPTDGETKLLTAIVAGDPPDVFTEWSPYIGQFADKDALMPLNQFMTGKYKGVLSWLYPVAANWGTYKGKLYGLPWTMNSLMLYYNKDLMKQAGLNPNDPPKTIQQLDADQAKMWKMSKKGAVQQIGFYPNNYEQWMPTWNVNVFQNGQYQMENNPQALNLMQWISSYSKYPYDQVSGYLQTFTTNSVDPFSMGKEGFYINGMWEIPTIQQYNPKMNYGVVPLPAPPGGNSDVTWINGNYNEIPKGAKHPQQAWEFITWLSGYDNEAWAAKSDPQGGWIPPSPKVTAEPAYQKWLNQNPLRKPFVNLMLNPKDGITPVTPVTQLFSQNLSDAVNYVLQGQKSAKAALASVQQTSNQALKTQG